ncbi:hypothetical protein OHT57_12675 [Streptomyces sp. NBC_00285]|uniref:hypothetical protein n=1 Tax=Streptomyces sp. NBC_00285 TaxID=2975700 RepID=UPI002E2A87DF|nr:hypothetical protein [Streptomyces sp. NBC_00285]
MDSKIWAAVIGGAASLVVFVAGLAAGHFKDSASRRAAAADKARAAAQELLRAAFDTKAALAIWEARWRDKRSIVATLGHSFAQILAGYRDDRIFHGTADGLASALAWRRASDAAEEALVTGPLSRMAAAAAQTAMLNDAKLREASTAVTDALGKLVTAYAEKPKSPARIQADRDVDDAIGRLSHAARSYKGRRARRATSE